MVVKAEGSGTGQNIGDKQMVYDCIPFFNELDILKLRLNILNPIVDRFIIEEATVTFSGEPKELCFEKNKEMFKEFLPKIEYIVVDNSPLDVTTHVRDNFQKNALERGLKGASDEDVIILSDVDEIPNPKVLKKIIAEFDPDRIYHLAQRMFYCFINMEEVSGKLLSITGEFPGVERKMWLGTKIFSKKSIPSKGIIKLREAPTTAANAVRVADGGTLGTWAAAVRRMCPKELAQRWWRRPIRSITIRTYWRKPGTG